MIYYRDQKTVIRGLQQSAEGKSISLVAEYKGNIAGYINVYPNSKWGAFANQGYPEIAEYADIVSLGAGMHSGYGSVQQMYVKPRYIPDGTGVWYGDTVFQQYADCKNDDDLILYLSKKLRDR